jgi:dihydroxyacid dehydratase/phosphogluconate dehydratase
VLADVKPSGKYFMNDLVKIGGTVPLIRILVNEGLMHGDCLTVTGKTMKENMKNSKIVWPKTSRSCVRSATRSRRTATSSSSKATSAPKVPSARSPARKASSSRQGHRVRVRGNRAASHPQ